MNKKDFENYLAKGTIKKYSPDKLRAQDLFKETESSYESLFDIVNKIGINKNNSNHL